MNFLARGRGYNLFLTSTEAVLDLHSATKMEDAPAESETKDRSVLQVQFVGSSPKAQPRGLDALPGRTNYFLGNDPSNWLVDIPNFARVYYDNVYPGIDLVYYGNPGRLEYDFIIAPGVDPAVIRLNFEGADQVFIDAEGSLVLDAGSGTLIQHAPVVYQDSGGIRRAVSARYALLGEQQVGFEISAYNTDLPLVIDPVLAYSTYLGGSLGDTASAVAVDDDGFAYVTGETGSTDFPLAGNPYQSENRNSNTVTDVFVTKVLPDGSGLVYSTYLGGISDDHGTGIAIDDNGNAYVTGWTNSIFESDDTPENEAFPTTPGAFQTAAVRRAEAFVTKLNSTGSQLEYSTFLGGDSDDFAYAIAVDPQHNAYVTGVTASFMDFPTRNPLQSGEPNSFDDAFLTKLNPTGTDLVYSTYIRGSNAETGHAVAADGDGNAYVVGETASDDFPTTVGSYQPEFGGGGSALGGGDAFLMKVDPTGSAYVFSTYFGRTFDEIATGVAADSTGNAYITGYIFGNSVQGSDLPVTVNAAQTTFGGGLNDAFVAKFNSVGSALAYSTYLGGGGQNSIDRANAIAVDSAGNAYVTGNTTSFNPPFPTVNPFQLSAGGDVDAFVTRVNPTGTAFDYSGYLGGPCRDIGHGIGADSSGNAYVVGETVSVTGGGRVSSCENDFPVKNAFDDTGPEPFDSDGFVTRIDLVETPDNTPGVFITPAAGLVTSESGGTATFTVALKTAPTGNVTIGLASTDTSEGTVSPSSLTFTPANALTPQTVTVTGVNDSAGDGNINYQIVIGSATSTDANYHGLGAPDISVSNQDNEPRGVELISANSSGSDSGNVGSIFPQVSGDGRYVVFQSTASDLDPRANQSNAVNVFVRDRLTKKTSLVSISRTGKGGNGNSHNAMVSGNGRFVVFTSEATDLVDNDTNGIVSDIFVRDLQENRTYLISANSTNTGSGDDESRDPTISADGLFVAFESDAGNLVAKDTNSEMRLPDVFVRDVLNQRTVLVSVNSDGSDSGNGRSDHGVISADGQHVLFVSTARDLQTVASDDNFIDDVFVRNLTTNTTKLVSVNRDGNAAGNQDSFITTSLNSGLFAGAPISANGRFVAFESFASDLVANDTNNSRDIFVRDLTASTPTLASINKDGTGSGNFSSFAPVISADGRFVAFESLASNLVPNDGDGTAVKDTDVFVHNVQTGATTLVSVNTTGNGSGNSRSFTPTISADGRYIAFLSDANDLIAGFTDNNGTFLNTGLDVFLRDLDGQSTILVTAATGSTTSSANSGSYNHVISADGKSVTFHSTADNFGPTDTNGGITGQTDIYVSPALHPAWQNPGNPLDVNNDSLVTPQADVLPLINELNLPTVIDALGNLPLVPVPPRLPPPFYDVSGDNRLTPVQDVLPIINFLNRQSSPEGEIGLDLSDVILPRFIPWSDGSRQSSPIHRDSVDLDSAAGRACAAQPAATGEPIGRNPVVSPEGVGESHTPADFPRRDRVATSLFDFEIDWLDQFDD